MENNIFFNSESILIYNSIISLSLINDSRDKRNLFYMMRSETLEENLIIKKCNISSDFYLIKESLFIIKELKETFNDGTINENEIERKNKEIVYNSHFLLQHLISKKYLAKDKNSTNNSYIIKLVEKEDLAIPFVFKRIVDNKSTQNSIQYNQIVYLSAYVKEKSQYYFINAIDNSHTNQKSKIYTKNSSENKSEYFDLILAPEFLNKFLIVNQEHFQDNFNERIYSGDLLNIVFTMGSDRRCMLGVETPKSKVIEIGNLKEEVKEDFNSLIIDMNAQNGMNYKNINKLKIMENKNIGEMNLKVSPIDYTKDEYFKHVNFFSFWVIEEEGTGDKKKIRSPILSDQRVRIKNAILNLYLALERKNEDEFVFILVEEEKLTINNFLISNFQITYYAINVEDHHLLDNGRYIIKVLFSNLNEFGKTFKNVAVDLNSFFSKFDSMTLFKSNDDLIVEPSESEFIFEIKKIPLIIGNEPIYIKSIINQLDIFVENFSLKKSIKYSFIIELIKRNLLFFSNYLLNLDSSFRDPNLNSNYPITFRQNLLMSYKILNIINKILTFFTKSNSVLKRDKTSEFNQTLIEQLKDLVKQIFLFLIYLSDKNERIKKKIFKKMKNILQIGDVLFKNKTILLYFVFKIVEGSTVLQEALFGELDKDKIFNVKFLKNNDHLNTQKINVTMNFERIFNYISNSPKYFYFYRKILNFEKLAYKKDEINSEIKKVTNNNKITFINNLKRKCNKLREICENGIKQGFVKREFYDNIRIFFNLLPKFDLYSFLYMKEYLLSALIKLSKPEGYRNPEKKEKENSANRNSNISPNRFSKRGSIRKEEGSKSSFSPDSTRKMIEKMQSGENINNNNKNNEANPFNPVIELISVKKDNSNSKIENVRQDSNNLGDELEKQFNSDDIIDLIKQENHNHLSTKSIEVGKGNIFLAKSEYFDTKLIYIMSNEIPESKYEEIFDFEIDPEVVATLPSKMFSDFFPQESLESIKDLQNESLKIINTSEMTKYLNFMNQKTIFEKFNRKLNNLIFYYQFTSFQFFEGLFSIYKMLKTYCINYMTISDIDRIISNLDVVREEIVRMICDLHSEEKLKNNIIETFLRIHNNSPSLLTNDFDFNQSPNEANEEDFYNYKYLFKFCKVNDKISFLLEKIKTFITLREILKNPEGQENFSENLKSLIKKSNSILVKFNDLKEEKEKYIREGNFSFYNIKYYILQNKFKFFTKLLCKYDINNYFDKIIYVKDEQQLKLMKNSSKEFKFLKENIQKIQGEYRNNLEWKDHQKVIEDMVTSLNQILSQFKTIFVKKKTRTKNFKEFYSQSIKTPEISKSNSRNFSGINSQINFDLINEDLLNMLKNEDSTYFKKIEFPNILKKLIEVLDIFITQKNKNNSNHSDVKISLEYCFLLLKCFKQLTKNYENFSKLVQNEYKDYINLILTSLKTVKTYLENFRTNVSREENLKTSETFYLNIIYQSAKCFLYLIEYCFVFLIESKNIPFADLAGEMKIIIKSYMELYDVIPENSRKVEYHIFYTFLISRILKILNREKVYDIYNYEIFYKDIFRLDVMKERINECISEIDSSENIKLDNKNFMQHKNNQNFSNTFSNKSFDTDSYESEESSQEDNNLVMNEKILFLNFLTIYTIYLNELNSVKNSSNDQNIKSQSGKIKFDTLINKISQYLDTSIQPEEEFHLRDSNGEQNPKKETKNFIFSKSLKKNSTLMDSNVNFNHRNRFLNKFTNNTNYIPYNDFNFEFILMKSIIFYKYEKKSIEVKIEINSRPYFLYYDTNSIDVLLLEKMMNEMCISKRLEQICKILLN